MPGDTSALTCEEWFSGKNADPVLISLQDGFVATKKEFITTQHQTQEENIFAVGMQTAPLREEDVSSLFCFVVLIFVYNARTVYMYNSNYKKLQTLK